MTESSSVSPISTQARLTPVNPITTSEFNNLLIAEISSLRKFARKFSSDYQEINDLVQDTLIKALRFWQKFRTGTSMKAWLFVIMKNNYINNYRKTALNRTIFDPNEDAADSSLYSNHTENAAESKFMNDDIKTALSKLPKDLQLPFKMYTDGYKYWEIAKQAGVPMETVKTRMHVGRIQLKKILKIYE